MQNIKSKKHPSKKLPNRSNSMGIQLASAGIEVGGEMKISLSHCCQAFYAVQTSAGDV